jgi:PHD/YefM family antitoxin component YafN of YafNO toxin-antitoxin module
MKFHVGTDIALIDPRNVHSLTDFQRNAKQHLRQLRKSKQPALFTVNGRGAVVMLDAAAFVKLMRRLDDLDETASLQKGLLEMEQGQGRPVSEFAREFRAKHGIGAKRKKTA